MLDFTNFRDHPSDKKLEVFHFFSLEQADCFESYLEQYSVIFERTIEEHESKEVYLFCTKRHQSKLAHRCNHLTAAKYRKPFISDLFFRYFVIIISVAAVGLAIMGYFFSK